MKKLIIFLAAVLCLASACTKEGAVATDGNAEIAGKKIDKLRCTYFHEEGQGYNIVLTQKNVLGLSETKIEEKCKYILDIDIPEEKLGVMHSLPADLDGDSWSFYITLKIGDDYQEFYDDAFSEGILYANINEETKEVEIFINITNTDGDTIVIKFLGIAAESKTYVWCCN